MTISGLIFFGLFLNLSLVLGLNIPSHNCDKYASYHTNDFGKHIDVIMAPQTGNHSIEWKVIFNDNNTGLPYSLKDQYLGDGESRKAFVSFQNFGTLPNLLRLEINGEVLCSHPSYDASSSVMTRYHRIPRDTEMDEAKYKKWRVPQIPSKSWALRNASGYYINGVLQPEESSSSTPKNIPVAVSALGPAAFLNSTGTYYDGVLQTERSPNVVPRKNIPIAVSALGPAAYLNSTGTYYDGVLQTERSLNFVPRVVGDFDECGREGFATSQIGGEELTRGQYPWLVALYIGRLTVTYKCVGSLISKQTVITAAHCIFNRSPGELWVYLGRHDRSMNTETEAELVGVSSVHTPSQYNGNPVPDADIGLLILSKSIVYTRYIQPLCLWTSDLGIPSNEGDLGAVAGWGVDTNAQKTRFPKSVYVQLVDRDRCRYKMPRAEDFITDRTVCAGNSRGHGPCFGDSGAALIVLRNNRWVIRGVVSLSPRLGVICDLSQYAIYCDVSTYVDWIREHMVV
ncbi:uncharacterized protein Dana_GF26735, isoform B [Drosophila ananassae]|uniref:Uncharacterized protein, isoform A n=1 Tax=Drosophila ananassae TaxID=7217 RepID=A0A0P8YGW3_DROAN|nr:serine protease 41 [Drosophila ananassae]KPU80584.1 uncharacterized protein Dana_GF26735, isoform A [Drosophila ananassae]KPU80585.1 uncharacterized protein Dana_GF26735, isoform B [Drosophila ananassae]